MYTDANDCPLHYGDRVRDAGGNLGTADDRGDFDRPDHIHVRWDDGTVSQVLPGQLVRLEDEPPCSVVHGHTGKGPCPECLRQTVEAERGY